MDKRITLEDLKAMDPSTVFAFGSSTEPILHTEEVNWVAKRGVVHDWAIYYHTSDKSIEWIEKWGDKCTTESVIRRLVPCDDSAFSMYRY